jgi:hypothetical protein
LPKRFLLRVVRRQPEYGRCVQDMPREFYSGIETDKLGELGTSYVLFHEMAGDRKYLTAALHPVEAVAGHVRDGDADHTPWPFRVDFGSRWPPGR